jgi:3',5'-cyclic-nucleotide phosphodiesterase
MKIRVLGCHGGASLHHRCPSFLIDGWLALDAGGLAGGLTLEEQNTVRLALVTHAHMDHVGELGILVDHRSQRGGPPLVVAGRPETISALRTHYFNGVLWPDFSVLPLRHGPAVTWRELDLDEEIAVDGMRVRPVGVSHSVPSCGFLVSDGRTSVAYSGDTGPTDRFWQVVNGTDDLGLVITEVSFPDAEAALARVSGHLTPSTFAAEIAKFRAGRAVPVAVYGFKPLYEREIRAELEALHLPGVRVLALGETLDV